MAVRPILLLNEPGLHQVCEPLVPPKEPGQAANLGLYLKNLIQDLKDTLDEYRDSHGRAMAIAAPQIGVRKRVVYLEPSPRASAVLINPVVTPLGQEMLDTWEDCMSIPDRLVKVRRYRTCRVTCLDPEWRETVSTLTGGLSLVIQHECDHLDGILPVDKAIDTRPRWQPERKFGSRLAQRT